MKVHHIGYAVANIQEAKKQFELLGYKDKSILYYDECRNSDILFMNNDTTIIELIAVHDKTKRSPIDFLIRKKMSPMPYHICYSVKNIQEAIKELQKSDFREITSVEPAIAIHNQNVSFLFNPAIGIIELVEETL